MACIPCLTFISLSLTETLWLLGVRVKTKDCRFWLNAFENAENPTKVVLRLSQNKIKCKTVKTKDKDICQ